MRSYYDEQLLLLNVELIRMGALCEDAIAAALKSLLDDDDVMSDKVASIENDINQKERDIETMCMKLLLKQQPVASDLRMISSALKMISDMERIGDQAFDIAELSKFIRGSDIISRVKIKEMSIAAIKMVTDSVDSFVKRDLTLAKDVIDYDDVVDNFFNEIKNELIELIASDSANGEYCLDLLMTAKYLERIGDHAVNIARRVCYSLTGTMV